MNIQTITDFLVSSHFLLSVAIVACAIAVWELLKRAVAPHIVHNADPEALRGKRGTYLRISANILKYVIVILTIVLVLQINDVNVSSLVTGLGIASAMVGLALQDVLKDIIMGMNILEDEFFVVGDVVKYGGAEGRVIAFTVKTTKIQDINTGSVFTISNRNISEIEKVSDWLDILVPTAYEESAGRILPVLETICSRIRSLPDARDCRLLGTEELGESAILYKLRVMCDPAIKPAVRRGALRVIQDVFSEAGVVVPYNQLDVHSK